MLDILRRTVQEVSALDSLDQALEIIVSRVKQVLGVDVCSAYLADEDRGEYVLRATDGFAEGVVHKVRLPFGTGLVGLVGRRAETVNMADGHLHPMFHFVEETGEDRLHGFLGAPIVSHRETLGVLVAQRVEVKDFSDEEVSFVVTLAAQLAGAITHAQSVDAVQTDESSETGQRKRFIDGLPGAPGVAMGKAVVVYPVAALDSVPDRAADDPEAEETAFLAAVAEVRQEVQAIADRLAGHVSAEEKAVFDAYVMMLSGDVLISETVEAIRAGQWAQGAWRSTIDRHARVFDAMEDDYLAERGKDLRDLGRRILMQLQQSRTQVEEYTEGTVLVGEDVSAMQLAEVPPGVLAGVVSMHGSGYSHVAILARAMGIPAVMGCSGLPVNRVGGRDLIADGYSGRVYVSPSETVRNEYERLCREEAELSRRLDDLREESAVTPDGVHVPLYANMGLLADVPGSIRSLAEGVGLFRTEFPFLIRDRFPGEDEQVRVYREVLEAFNPGPVVLRTLDAGGDKPLPYFPVNEENPFLGWRGIRLTLDHPEIFLVQLRAMLRANEGLGNLHLLLPMISSVHEVDEALVYLDQAIDELREEGLEAAMPPVGVMIEVPSVVYQIDALSRRVDFFSVGTNDLTQYLLAVDRNNERVADLYDHLHPSVIRALRDIVKRAHRAGKPVSVCGEMADDPAAVLVLLGLGMDSLSMSTGSLSRVKWVVRSFDSREARRWVDRALEEDDAVEIREMLTGAIVDAGLGGLIRAGKA
ncbi:MAG: phosphoenolpyruvate--protein phosphotransferase [Gammaproteobacteria bacterium]